MSSTEGDADFFGPGYSGRLISAARENSHPPTSCSMSSSAFSLPSLSLQMNSHHTNPSSVKGATSDVVSFFHHLFKGGTYLAGSLATQVFHETFRNAVH